jgi:uncharacterized membrane-anchored protein YhcB (DUF1043 family)
MLKLLICLVCAMGIGVGTLLMRQQELELKHRATALQGRIEAQQAKLWSQQLQISTLTAPNAIRNTIGDELDLVPGHQAPIRSASWLER